tara:strand:- start:28 stop:768 length:741 start_codon:yes stop_codon:yes gene_type:complete
MSNRPTEVIFSASVVSGIAEKLKKKLVLFVKEKPRFSAQYKNVDFISDLPSILAHRKRVIHEDALFTDDDVYLNTWRNQLRGAYAAMSIDDAAKKIANEHLKSLGIRRRITGNDILKASLPAPVEKKNMKSKFLVCIDESALPNINFNSLMSSVDIADYVGFFDVQKKYLNFKSVGSSVTYSRSLHEADAIITLSPAFLVPYYHCAYDKKIITFTDGGKEYSSLFADIISVAPENIRATLKAIIRQ